MRAKSTLFNQRLAAVVTGLRFDELIVIADAGLPVPPGVETLDLALTHGKPSVADVLAVLVDELVIHEVIVAEETGRINPTVTAAVEQLTRPAGITVRAIPHDDIEVLIRRAKLVVQTGETTPYGNVVLAGGLDFFELGIAD
ncbi:MAG: D-ribose pyranase [Actinobacteria bacterium]|jgi:D-ribose pyranase|nr:D-ribose pyranase [Actinomycetota bacterium]